MDILNTENLPKVDATKVSIDSNFISEKYERAKNLYEKAVIKYNERMKNDVDESFAFNMLKDGTLADKVSAAIILVQRSPLHKLDILKNTLIEGMATKKSKREALLAVDSIKDLFVDTLLPNDRKLKYFRDQPLADEEVLPRHLVVWYYEDELKKSYFAYIQILEQLAKDALLFVRSKSCQVIFDLLVTKPEQEQNLLNLLVNKIGDQEKKVSSKIVFLLSQVLVKHPAMKSILVHYVEQFVFKSSVSLKAQYYSITFLNQIVLSNSPSDVEVAKKLVSLYFTLFDKFAGDKKKYLSAVSKMKLPAATRKKINRKQKLRNEKKKELSKESNTESIDNKKLTPEQLAAVDSKIMAALLIGVTRAFPYANLSRDVYDSHLDTIFRISHHGSFTVLVQCLTLVFQIQSETNEQMDRFYRSLYDSLLDPRLLDTSRQAMYLNLLYRAMKRDNSESRIKAFVKRILQICSLAQPHFICAALFVISEVSKHKFAIRDLFKHKKYSSNDTKPNSISLTESMNEDDVKTFKDVVEKGEEQKEETISKNVEIKLTKTEDKLSEKSKNVISSTCMMSGYDPIKREPLYAKAELSHGWEILSFIKHFHPTVALYASILYDGKYISTPEGKAGVNYDPLQNHTLSRFLDKFVLKNPKTVKTIYRGSSLMQPQATVTGTDRVISSNSKVSRVILAQS